jgi:hypothetical protein
MFRRTIPPALHRCTSVLSADRLDQRLTERRAENPGPFAYVLRRAYDNPVPQGGAMEQVVELDGTAGSRPDRGARPISLKADG